MLYVCDRGNNRVQIFTASEVGKPCANPNKEVGKCGFRGEIQVAPQTSAGTALCTASVTAAAVGLPFVSDAATAIAEPQVFRHEPSQLLTAERTKAALQTLVAKPGKKNDDAIFGRSIMPFTVALTVESNTSDTQFEYHEDRDHLFQILDGETVLEVDGTPKGGHSEQPGQWHSPTSEGTTVHTLHKGDMFLIPRGAPHKRSTERSVTFMLISVTSPLKG